MRGKINTIMPSKNPQTAPDEPALPAFRPRTSIRGKVLRQSVLLVSFCVLLLGGLSFYIIRSFQDTIPAENAGVLFQVHWLGITVLTLSGLLMVLALLLGTFLARGLTYSLQQLTEKVQALRPGTWSFRRTLDTGDEVEALDRVVADLTSRLRDAYEHLEDKVAERTEQLRRESALDRAILDTIDYGVVTVDAHGVITDINPTGMVLLQRKKNECVRRNAADVLAYVEKKKRCTGPAHPLAIVLKTRTSFRSHAGSHPSLLRKDEGLLPVTLTVAPLLIGKKLHGAIVVFQDMAEERQIDYMKTEFISLASHQLRTPLASIRWYVELLGGDGGKSLTEDQASYFKEIEKASGRMANLLEALLHVARIDGGVIIPEIKDINLRDLLVQMNDEWSILCNEKALTFEAAVPDDPIPLKTDPILLQIILQNFFTNAVKYSQRNGQIHLRARIEAERLILSVQDAGIGIPVEEQKRVFEKFFRAHNVRTMDTDGTGLGLYISKAIAERLGGRIFFESTEGKGSTFTLILPVK